MHRATFTRDRLGSRWVDVSFPYDAEYVAAIKRVVPSHCRTYNKLDRVWSIDSHWRDPLEKAFRSIEWRRDDADDARAQRGAYEPPKAAGRTMEQVLTELFQLMPQHLRTPAHRALIKVAHPDVGGDTEMAKALNLAWQEVAA